VPFGRDRIDPLHPFEHIAAGFGLFRLLSDKVPSDEVLRLGDHRLLILILTQLLFPAERTFDKEF
jgi:hypothetical protein